MNNPFLSALHRALPRLLSFYNMDSTSKKFGVGDRYYWAWKLIDFANGTYQAAVHGLSLLIVHQMLPSYITEQEMLNRIHTIVIGISNIISRNGSLDEAWPNESSFCVSALVASDVLAAYENLKSYLTEEQTQFWLDTVKLLIEFLKKQDEYHGLISNHLASAALVMYRWHSIVHDEEAYQRGKKWLDRILKNQSNEGWYSEYGGADPGYQTWCTGQLAQLYKLTRDSHLKKSLKHSLSFLVYAAHPDGSFGGNYGSRNTRFLMPGGIIMLASEDENASALASFAIENFEKHHFVNLDCIDEGNLVPFFNDCALAASYLMHSEKFCRPAILPCYASPFKIFLSDSGWLIDKGEMHYTIINIKKGGAMTHFFANQKTCEFSGVILKKNKNMIFSTQKSTGRFVDHFDLKSNDLMIDFPLQKVSRPHPKAFDFVILRLMSLTLFKSVFCGNLVKRFMSYYLIRKSQESKRLIRKKFHLGPEFKIEILSSPEEPIYCADAHFSSIHMASQGYWQKGDDLIGIKI